MTDLLVDTPDTVGEILRAVAWCADPPHHYASAHDLRTDLEPVDDVRATVLWTCALDYLERWRIEGGADEASATIKEAVTDGRVAMFRAWDWTVTVGVWWDGDGTIFFHLAGGEDGEESVRMVVNHDSKKVYRWKDVAPPAPRDR